LPVAHRGARENETDVRELTLSIDAMGGDAGPEAVIAGAAICRVRHPKSRFIFHGDEAVLTPLLRRKRRLAKHAEIRHAPDVVKMGERPSQALRRGRNSSMWRAIESVAKGEAQVVVSCGNTGALMAMSMVKLGIIDGVSRPAIAAIWPTMRAQSVVLDVGANAGCDAEQLVDFAVMGEAFARAIFGIERPSVALLNIGEEEVKGIESVKRAAQILRASQLPIEFRGFIEGDDIGTGLVDVVVTDGFTGNVALKTAEGTARLVGHFLRAALTRSIFGKLGAILAGGALRTLRKKMDPRSVNGGTFLGLNGAVVKSHGGTDALGFASALDLAVDLGQSDVIARIAADRAGIATKLDNGAVKPAAGGQAQAAAS
jgi:glycerol-3-phosphate acyltransferase PlsX